MRRRSLIRFALPAAALLTFLIGGDAVQAGGPPAYEQAFVFGKTVTINAIEVPQVANDRALADFYQVVYPIDWAARGLNPQCQPCDHDGQGIDFIDFHDHVLDSMPSSPGHGEFSPSRRMTSSPARRLLTPTSTSAMRWQQRCRSGPKRPLMLCWPSACPMEPRWLLRSTFTTTLFARSWAEGRGASHTPRAIARAHSRGDREASAWK